eukprot:TRINITY_DN4283_c0_g1_i2.p1 TRINITY_DN4283_c0_g1~~TRINITY_DN4283_c0_g1_i2.p1  ORF type:complete len:619 (+),score=171.13 TRINITY_DN4283_c0_g1_i2:35-1891(+)
MGMRRSISPGRWTATASTAKESWQSLGNGPHRSPALPPRRERTPSGGDIKAPTSPPAEVLGSGASASSRTAALLRSNLEYSKPVDGHSEFKTCPVPEQDDDYIAAEEATQLLWSLSSEYEELMRLQREHSAAVTRQRESQRMRLQAEVQALSGELDESAGAVTRIQSQAFEAEAAAEANKHRLQMLTTLLRLRDLQQVELSLLFEVRQKKTSTHSLATQEPEEEVDGGSTAAGYCASASSSEHVRRSLFQEQAPADQQQQAEFQPGLEQEVAFLRQQVEALEQALAEPQAFGLQAFPTKSVKQSLGRIATSTSERVQHFCAVLVHEEECMANLAKSGMECSRLAAQMLADLRPLMRRGVETEGTESRHLEQAPAAAGVEHLLRLAEEAFGESATPGDDASSSESLCRAENSAVEGLPSRGLAAAPAKNEFSLPEILAEALREVRGLHPATTTGAAAAAAAAAAVGCDTPSTAAVRFQKSEDEAEGIGAARQASAAAPAATDSPGGCTSNSSPESTASGDSTRYRPQPGDPVDVLLADFLNQRRNRLRRSLFTRVDQGLYRYGTRSTHLRLGPTLDELEAAEAGTDTWEPLEDFARRLERWQSDRLRRARQRAKALSIT